MTDTNTSGEAFAKALDATIARSSDAVKVACGMSTASGADVLAKMDRQHEFFIRAGRYNGREGCWFNSGEEETVKAEYASIRTAVAALIAREAIQAGRIADLSVENSMQAKRIAALITERDALAAEVKALRDMAAEYIAARDSYESARKPSSSHGMPVVVSHGDPRVIRYRDALGALARASAATGGGNG